MTDPKTRKVLVIENPLLPNQVKDMIARVLFDNLQVRLSHQKLALPLLNAADQIRSSKGTRNQLCFSSFTIPYDGWCSDWSRR